jgi:sulfate adenylyltransferase
MTKELIPPHGGRLMQCCLPEGERQSALQAAQTLPRLTLSERNLADLECIATGVYSPLEGFVSEQNYHSIVSEMRLSNGLAWSIPVTLQVQEPEAESYKLDSDIALMHPNGDLLAVMTITSKYLPDQQRESQQVYKTTDTDHPGVKALLAEGSVYPNALRRFLRVPANAQHDASIF